MFKKLIDIINKNKKVILSIVLVIAILIYLNKDRLQKLNIIRKTLKDEFDNFDIEAHKHYVEGGAYVAEQAPANVVDYTPTKTSELVAYCDESIEECIQY